MPSARRSVISLTRLVTALLGIILLVLIAFQASSLFTAPQPDAARWFGDETWQMRQFQAQMQTGILHDSDAPLSSIARNNGLIPNSLWLNAIIYGGPVALLFPAYSVVTIGRAVTFVLTLLLIAYLYWTMRRRDMPPWFALATCIILVSSRAFFFASHSARYDLFVGLGVLLAFDFLLYITDRLRRGEILRRLDPWLLAAFPALALTWNTHLARIVALPYIALVVILARKRLAQAGLLLLENILAVALLVLPSFLLIGSLNLFSATSGPSMLGQTFGNMPLLHQFSVGVVRATFVERFWGIEREAAIALGFALSAFVVVLVFLVAGRFKEREERIHLLLLALAVLSWMVTLRFVAYYAMQILPLLVSGSAILVFRVVRQSKVARQAVSTFVVVIALVSTWLGIKDALIARQSGQALMASLHEATSQAVAEIRRERNGTLPTVLVGLQLQDLVQQSTDIRWINALYREYPDAPITASAFLDSQKVNYVLARSSDELIAQLDTTHKAGPPLRFFGHFSDAGFDYFQETALPEDTLVLQRLRSR